MTEHEMEDLLWAYPDRLLGEPLKQLDRQSSSPVGRHDISFIDRIGRILVVEVKRGTLPRNAIAQLIDYYGTYKARFPDKAVELMVVANDIPKERRVACEQYNIEAREIPEKRFREVAAEVGYVFKSEAPTNIAASGPEAQIEVARRFPEIASREDNSVACALPPDIKPTGKPNLVDLLREAGMDVSKGVDVYGWAFVDEPAKLVVLCVWYGELRERGGTVEFSRDCQASIGRNKDNRIRRRHATEFDRAVRLALQRNFLVRVIVGDGRRRDPNDPNARPSNVKKRMLDPMAWRVARYDSNGVCTIIRDRGQSGGGKGGNQLAVLGRDTVSGSNPADEQSVAAESSTTG